MDYIAAHKTIINRINHYTISYAVDYGAVKYRDLTIAYKKSMQKHVVKLTIPKVIYNDAP
jgi:hypothetical protein